MLFEKPIVIIGSGLAGYMTAKEFRKLNSTTPLILITEQDGRFYSKPQLSNAFALHKTPDELTIASLAQMREQLNAEIMPHTSVIQIDPKAQVVSIASFPHRNDEQAIPYAKLILACGATPFALPLAENTAAEIPTINHLEAYANFREQMGDKKHIAILGTGLVGCEFANDWANTGFNISLISLDPTPLARLVPAEIGRVLQQAFISLGITWHLNRVAVQVAHEQTHYRIILSDQSEIRADLVLSAIGIRPNVALAQRAGCVIQEGILVDSYLQTTVPNIYALGDCAAVNGAVRLFVAPLLLSAKALAKTLAGMPTAVEFPPMPIVIKTPACPITVVLPKDPHNGAWEFTESQEGLRGLFYNGAKQLTGLALTGLLVRERMELMRQLVN